MNQFSNSKSYDSSKDKKDSEISQLKSEIHNMNQIIKSYEDQSVKMSEIEKKMKNINAKHEKEIKNLEEKYHEKMKVFSKKLLKYEEITKTASSFRTSRKEEDEEDKHVNNYIRNIYLYHRIQVQSYILRINTMCLINR